MSSRPKIKPRGVVRAARRSISVEDYLARRSVIECDIIDAAASLFRKRGFANVRMQDIGHAVGLSKAGLYHHCPSKESLLADIVRLCGELLTIQLQSAQSLHKPPKERLKAFVVSRMESIARHQDLFTIIWQERPFINRADFSDIAKRAESYRTGVRRIIEDAKDAGEISSSVNTHLLMLALDGMTGWAYLWYRAGGAETPAQIGEAFWNFISSGILASRNLPIQ